MSGPDAQRAVAELVERELCLAALDPAQTGVYVWAPGWPAFELARDTLSRAVTLGPSGRTAARGTGEALFALEAG